MQWLDEMIDSLGEKQTLIAITFRCHDDLLQLNGVWCCVEGLPIYMKKHMNA